MGSILFEAEAMFGSLSDAVGVQPGLALADQRIRELLTRDEHARFGDFIRLQDEDRVRIESVTFEEMFEFLLFAVGRLERPYNPRTIANLYHRYKDKPKKLKIILEIDSRFTDFLNHALSNPDLKRGDKIDPSAFLRECLDRFGKFGVEVADELLTNFSIQLMIKSSHFPAVSEWADTAELEGLFRSEGLNTQYGRFFDQRYIDYLHRNVDDIDRINWRKFEGMTAEYFDRQGFRVNLGPGRNDGGVDVRVWPADEAAESPPAILIQCKRQKQAVSKVVVKSLYADVLDAKATSGLIVTTAKLSQGAKDVCSVRQYPLVEADRNTIREWIGQMRKPGLGSAT